MNDIDNEVPENVRKAYIDRDKLIIKTSIVGIIANILLSVFKAIVGISCNSIAIILDAVNNLSDALSSVITIIGTKLANKLPDRKHPLGHGRAEYLSAMLVSAIVLYAGITSAIESVKKILHPVEAEYTLESLAILVIAIIVKLVLGKYVKRRGKTVNSGALIASGADATFDAVISLSVLISAIVFLSKGISLEAYVGIFISIVIIKSGIEMMMDTLNDILGKRADAEKTKRIRKILESEPEVLGAYDLILNNYGPERDFASVHLELPDVMTVEEVDLLTRRVQAKVYNATGVILIGVGVYSYNTKGGAEFEMRNHVQKTVMSHDWALQLHGFYVDIEAKDMRFDVVISFDIDTDEGLSILKSELEELYPDYKILITADVDVSD